MVRYVVGYVAGKLCGDKLGEEEYRVHMSTEPLPNYHRDLLLSLTFAHQHQVHQRALGYGNGVETLAVVHHALVGSYARIGAAVLALQ